jgi:tryptophanyl-tRNA synthetase
MTEESLTTQNNIESDEQIVTATNVSASKNGFDYKRLIEKFGVEEFTQELKQKFENVTGHKVHYLIERGLFFSHVGLNGLLDAYQNKKQIYIYTGRGPSTTSMHLGHLIPFFVTKWLQDVFQAIVVIQMSDDEKFYFKDDLSIDDCEKYGRENAKDIIACGFDPSKTYIFSNYRSMGRMYTLACKFLKEIRVKDINSMYGADEEYNIGKVMWPVLQTVPAFSQAFPEIFGTRKDVYCLIPAAIDQAPYFRMANDLAKKFKFRKPCLLFGKFLPGLSGIGSKMSSTSEKNAKILSEPIFLDDTSKNISKKIKSSFSGGGDTFELHQKNGANLNTDVPYQYLTFLEKDSDKLKHIADEYSSGRMLTGEIKQILIDRIIEIIENHKLEKAKITEDILNNYFTEFNKRK